MSPSQMHHVAGILYMSAGSLTKLGHRYVVRNTCGFAGFRLVVASGSIAFGEGHGDQGVSRGAVARLLARSSVMASFVLVSHI